MRSPISALVWGIWARSRQSILVAVGATVIACLGNLLLPESVRFNADGSPSILIALLNFNLAGPALLLMLSVFSYTEFNPHTNKTGFPYRLFVLPVSSFTLVAVPMLLGAVTAEVFALAWGEAVFGRGDLTPWFLVAMPVYMILYQTIQWTLSRLGPVRLMLLGLLGFMFIVLPIFRFPTSRRPLMSSLNPLIWSAAGMAVAAFFVSWAYVARERSGGGSGVYWIKAFVGRFQDPFPRRVKIFRSPAAAQFWFEWQRFGLVLPLLVGAILVALIIPISLYMRNETDSTVRTLLVTLAMPIVFAWPIGKGFSKPDFWSQDLSLSPFVAVRPITTVDLVLIKMKVAGVSAALSWLLVLIFLCVWLPLWGNLELLTRAGSLVRQSYGASSFPQYAIAMLLLVAAVFLTWRFLVGGLWLGLSGNKKAFMISALPYLFSPMIMIIGLFLLFGRRSAPDFSNIDLDRIPVLEVIAALAVIVKFSLWVFSWRDVAGERVNQYFLFWIGSTLSMLLLAILLWVVARPHLPDDADGVRNLLLLIAVLIVPLARIGHAPAALAKNRHR